MIRTATRLTLLILPAVVGLLATAGVATAKTPCWKLLVNDWYDGRIDRVYPIACYREALKHLPTDIREYSSAFDDINRALAARIASTSAATAKKQPPAAKKPASPPKKPAETNQAVAPLPANDDPPPPPAARPKPKPKPTSPNPPSAATTPTETAAAPPVATTGPPERKPTPKPAAKPVAPPPPAPTQGRQANGGVVSNAIQDIGSDSADSLPIPLLVLGSLAILLLLLGTAGFIARRLKARKAEIRPRPQAP